MLIYSSGFEAGTIDQLQAEYKGKRWRNRGRDRTYILMAFGINERGLREITLSGRAAAVETIYEGGIFGLERILPDGSRQPICAWREA